MNALGSLGFEQLKGIVESDETFFKESMKGKRRITHREAKERGGKDPKRGISNLKIAVVVAQDRNGNSVARKASRGRVRADEIDAVIGEYIDSSALFAQIQLRIIRSSLQLRGLNTKQLMLVKKGTSKKAYTTFNTSTTFINA